MQNATCGPTAKGYHKESGIKGSARGLTNTAPTMDLPLLWRLTAASPCGVHHSCLLATISRAEPEGFWHPSVQRSSHPPEKPLAWLKRVKKVKNNTVIKSTNESVLGIKAGGHKVARLRQLDSTREMMGSGACFCSSSLLLQTIQLLICASGMLILK